MNKEYKPHAKEAGILDRAMEHVKSVPYRVTPRWLFYRVFRDTTLCSWRQQNSPLPWRQVQPNEKAAGKPIASPKGRRKPMPP